MGCHFWNYKKPILFTLPYCELPYGEAYVARNRWLFLKASKDSRLANSHMNDLRNGSPPSWALRWLQPWPTPRLQFCERSWGIGRWKNCPQIPDPWKLWDGVCCFKSLSLGVICNTPIHITEIQYTLLYTHTHIPTQGYRMGLLHQTPWPEIGGGIVPKKF